MYKFYFLTLYIFSNIISSIIKNYYRLAALEGHYDTVRVLLAHNADVNAKDADGRSTLYILALENRLAMARFLLEHARADVESRDSEVNKKFL